MSTGRQGSKSRRSSCISKGSAVALSAAALTPAQKRSSRRAQLGVERGRLALGDAADAERAHQPVDRQPLGPRPSRRPGRRPRGGRSPSARAGPGRGRSPGRTRGRRARRPRRGARPSGRAAPAPGRPARRARSSRFCFGSGRRASQCQAAAVAAVAIPVPATPASEPDPCRSTLPSSLKTGRHGQMVLSVGQADQEAGPRPRAFRGGPPSPSPPSAAARSGCRPRPRRAGRRGSARPAPGRRAGAARASRGARRIRRAWRPGR